MLPSLVTYAIIAVEVATVCERGARQSARIADGDCGISGFAEAEKRSRRLERKTSAPVGDAGVPLEDGIA